MDVFEVRSRRKEEIIDVTAKIVRFVEDSGIHEGLCVAFVPHTTAGLTINENADPDVKSDLLAALKRSVPDTLPYAHAEGNSPAHVKASLFGSSVTVIVSGGRLRLGTWQGICLSEFDGPRTRKVWVKLIGA
jgi:secondary thiamine-phosphate synthase enzyme